MKTSFLRLFAGLAAVLLVGVSHAAKENFDRSKPHLNIGTIGGSSAGSAQTTQAIAAVFRRHAKPRTVRYVDAEGSGEILLTALTTKIKSGHRQYRVYDFDDPDASINLITGAAPVDGAILVVSAPDGPMPQTREHVLLARQVGVPAIVVFMNKVDQVDDEELLDLVELEIRELLSRYGYDGDNVPVIRGSALGALRGEPRWQDRILQLVAAADVTIPKPVKPVDKDFLMPVEDVFSITGRGTVATGRIETGVINTGDEVDIVGLRQEVLHSTVTGVEMFRKILDRGEAGDNVGLLLRGIEKSDIRRGMVIAKPGSITPHQQFGGAVYVLPEDQGGGAPLEAGRRYEVSVFTATVPATVLPSADGSSLAPGEYGPVSIVTDPPLALKPGFRFAIREGGRTVGAGQVTEIPR